MSAVPPMTPAARAPARPVLPPGRRIAAWSAAWIALAALLAVRPLDAQSCNVSGGVGTCAISVPASITVGTAVAGTLPATTLGLTTPTAGDFDAGASVTTAGLTVFANRSWTLLVSAAATTWTTSGGSPSDPVWAAKPISDLQWGLAAGGPTWTGLSTTATTVTTGTGATANTGAAVTMYFRMLHGWTTDTPGTYSLPVTYTITAP